MARQEAPERTYWVQPGRLLAGPHPRQRARESMLPELVRCGFNRLGGLFVDLTEPGEVLPAGYAKELLLLAPDRERPTEYLSRPIADGDVPSPEQMAEILDRIEAALAGGGMVYLHCYAGQGRTGTVVGCYLVRGGMEGARALEEIRRRRRVAHLVAPSPETSEQRELVSAWPRLDPGSPARS